MRAGQALDPNKPGGPSLALGQRLLGEALVAGARAACDDPAIDSVEAARRALARRTEGGGAKRAERRLCAAVASLDPLQAPDEAALATAEFEVARLVDAVTGTNRVARAERRARWSIAVVVVAAASLLIVANRTLYQRWDQYRWTASSAWTGYPRSGKLGEHDWKYDLFFHTLEESNPWVVVDLLSTRTIEEVTVVNRSDCCRERGLPLVMELARDDGQFTEIGAQSSPFETWRVSFRPRKARYVRLRARGRTILHFRDVQVR
jgi:hypothetical protein